MPIYKRNFLKKVILRLDFDKLDLDFLSKFSEEIKAEMPFQEQKETTVGSILIELKSGQVEQSKQKDFIWNFSDIKKIKKLSITKDSLVLEYNSYADKNELLADITNLVLKFVSLSKLQAIKRLGLRYINEIDLHKEKEKKSWDTYITKELVGSMLYVEKIKLTASRAMGQLALKFPDADILFNYGIWNSDFPNEITQNEFLLDYDCFTKFPIGDLASLLPETVKNFNMKIEGLFEESITREFRNLLNT